MQTGMRKLDRLVAEKVMGWNLFNYETGEEAKSEADYDDAANNDGWTWTGEREAWEWRPSESIAAAWRVVEKLHGSFHLQLNNLEKDGRWAAAFTPWRILQVPDYVSAETAPLAICLAAMKALDVEVPRDEEEETKG